jgi:predicted  nucleic acid-binding Zn-ribbon protein
MNNIEDIKKNLADAKIDLESARKQYISNKETIKVFEELIGVLMGKQNLKNSAALNLNLKNQITESTNNLLELQNKFLELEKSIREHEKTIEKIKENLLNC